MGYPNQAEFQKAVWRATQDMKAAVRFFRKDAGTTNTYKVDPNYIFVGGYSAGAFMAVQYAYLDQSSEIPATIDTTALGGLQGSSGNPGYSTNINGVLNFAGAVGDTSWIHSGDVPMVTAQGNSDGTIPYCTDMLFIPIFSTTVPIVVVSGGGSMHIRCFHTGIYNPIHTYYGQDHDASISTFPNNIDSTIFLASNFVYNLLGCTPSSSPAIYINNQTCVPDATGINNAIVLKDDNVSIYPNPAHDVLYVNIPSNAAACKTELVNILEELVLQQQIKEAISQVQLNNVINGVYYLKIYDNKNFVIGLQKVVVTN